MVSTTHEYTFIIVVIIVLRTQIHKHIQNAPIHTDIDKLGESFVDMVAFKKAVMLEVKKKKKMFRSLQTASCQNQMISWAEGPHGCWEVHHPVQW